MFDPEISWFRPPPGAGATRVGAVAALLLPLLAACATPDSGQPPANARACVEPRPQFCTMDYNPVCATRDSGIRCVTTPGLARAQATYANACGACADARVFYHLPGACVE